MREGEHLGGALLVKDLSTIPAVVFAVREGEGGPAAEADIGVAPLGRSLGVDHG